MLNLCFEREGGKREEEIEVLVDEVMSPQRYLHTNVTSHGKGDYKHESIDLEMERLSWMVRMGLILLLCA